MTGLRSLFVLTMALCAMAVSAAAQSLTPIDVDATCKIAWGNASTGADLRTVGNPESIGCKVNGSTSENGVSYLSPMQMCIRTRGFNNTAVLLNPADWRSWACAEPGAALPAGSVSAALPAPPMTAVDLPADLEAKYRTYVDRHVMAITPRPFYAAARFDKGMDVLWKMEQVNGNWVAKYSYFPQRYFGRNILVLVATSDASLRASGAVAAVDRMHASLFVSNRELGRDTAKVVILGRGLAGVTAASMNAYAAAGFEVWTVPKPEDEYDLNLSIRHGAYLVNQLSFVDRHGFIRGVANPVQMLRATEAPEGAATPTIRWLPRVYGSTRARALPTETTLTRLLQETVLAGRVADSPQSMPARVTLTPAVAAQIAAFRARTEIQGTEIGANLILNFGELKLDTNGVRNEKFSTYLVNDKVEVFSALATTDPDCATDTCPAVFTPFNRLAGQFHTHPDQNFFSPADLRNSYFTTNVSLLSVSTGEIALVLPTAASTLSAEEGAGVGASITNARFAAFYVNPWAMQACAVENANERIWRAAAHAAAFGMALYLGRGDTLSRVDPPSTYTRMGRRPIAAMFDANGGLIEPLDRLRIATLLRVDMPIDSLADDLSPDDAFNPSLSARSRALLKGRKLDASLVEELFGSAFERTRAQANRPDYDDRYKMIVAAPSISWPDAGIRMMHETNWCEVFPDEPQATQRWFLRPRAVIGKGSAAVRQSDPVAPWARLVTTTAPNRVAQGCAIELQIQRAADAAGQRQVDFYCQGGNAYRARFDEASKQFGPVTPQARWKP